MEYTAANVALTLPGSLSVSGTFNAGTGVYTLSGTTKTISGTLTIPSVVVTGTYTNNGTLTVSTALTGAGGLTNGAAGMLNIGGTSTISTLTATASGNIVNYNGSGTQTVIGTTYAILKINNTAGATLGGASTVTTLAIGDATSSSIFNDGGYQVTSTGTLNLTSGTFKLGSASTATTFPAFATSNISSGTTVDMPQMQFKLYPPHRVIRT